MAPEQDIIIIGKQEATNEERLAKLLLVAPSMYYVGIRWLIAGCSWEPTMLHPGNYAPQVLGRP